MSQVRKKKNLFSNLLIAWSSSLYGFDLISVLNLLDRHYNPRKLLRDVYVAALRSNCSVLVAIVLPIDQYVEFHPSKRTNRAGEKCYLQPFYVLEDVVFLLHPLPTETLRLSSSNGFTYVSNEL
uniref:Uncharacterized protein n=1 Tax=Angiostrongylus cantonensis TaxID=6313 RepID=A0A0K0DRM1_ANGCA